MKTTEVPVDDELLALLDGEGADAGRALHEAAILELYRRGSISAGRAAALLDMEKWAFVRWAGDLGIPYFRFDPDDLSRELNDLRDL
jgi:predicted HTH domain antitoxin